MHRTKIVVSAQACWLLCVCLLLLPLKFVLAWFISVAVHEGFHYLALRVCSCSVPMIKIGMLGAHLMTGPLSRRAELVCAAAGPLGGFLLLIFIKVFPLLSVLGFLHSIFNLIPLFPLDGGRIAHCLINRFIKDPERVKLLFDGAIICVLLGVTIYGTVRLSLGVLAVLAVVCVALKRGKKILLQT